MYMRRIEIAQVFVKIYDKNNKLRGNATEMFCEDGDFYVEITKLNDDGTLYNSPDICEYSSDEKTMWDKFYVEMERLSRHLLSWSNIDKKDDACTIEFKFYNNSNELDGKLLKISKYDHAYYVETIPFNKDGSLHIEPIFVEEITQMEDAWNRFQEELYELIRTIEVWAPARNTIIT